MDICNGAFYSRIVRLDGTGAYIDTIYISEIDRGVDRMKKYYLFCASQAVLPAAERW